MNRKRISQIYLSLVAIMPMVIGIYQVTHFIYWLFGIEKDFTAPSSIIEIGYFGLVICFLISLYEKFCIYRRIVICGCFYASASYYIQGIFPTITLYNITNMIAVACIAIGLIGCIIHFGYQIGDFIRYVRTKR